MDEYPLAPANTARCSLEIADHFSGYHNKPYTRIEALTKSEDVHGTLWIMRLQPGRISTYLHRDNPYWVRDATLYEAQSDSFLVARVAFSVETGKFLKLVPLSSDRSIVYRESGPVTHILDVA